MRLTRTHRGIGRAPTRATIHLCLLKPSSRHRSRLLKVTSTQFVAPGATTIACQPAEHGNKPVRRWLDERRLSCHCGQLGRPL